MFDVTDGIIKIIVTVSQTKSMFKFAQHKLSKLSADLFYSGKNSHHFNTYWIA